MTTKNNKGFTLIELLVTMTIIAVLAGLSLISFDSARKSSRDSKRKTDLEQMRAALEMYRADNGSYPATADFFKSGVLYPKYLASIPPDPSGRVYSYVAGTPAAGYTLCAALEVVTTVDPKCAAASANCGSGNPCSYSATSP